MTQQPPSTTSLTLSPEQIEEALRRDPSLTPELIAQALTPLPPAEAQCPFWCPFPEGHPYEGEDIEKQWRVHEVEVGVVSTKSGQELSVAISARESRSLADGQVTVGQAAIGVYGELIDATADEAMELANVLAGASWQLQRINRVSVGLPADEHLTASAGDVVVEAIAYRSKGGPTGDEPLSFHTHAVQVTIPTVQPDGSRGLDVVMHLDSGETWDLSSNLGMIGHDVSHNDADEGDRLQASLIARGVE